MEKFRYLDHKSLPWLLHGNGMQSPAALIGISVCFFLFPFEKGPEALAWCVNDFVDKTREHLSLVAVNAENFKKFRKDFPHIKSEDIAYRIANHDEADFQFEATSAKDDIVPGHFMLQVLYEDIGHLAKVLLFDSTC